MDARGFVRAIRANTSLYWDRERDYDTFRKINMRLWAAAHIHGIDDEVMSRLRSGPGYFGA